MRSSASTICGLLLLLAPSSFLGQTKPKSASPTAPAPLQAELIAPLDLTHVHPGSVFFARVQTGWHDGSCVLTPGSVVKGHVASLRKRSKADKHSSLELAFDGADCKSPDAVSPYFALLAMVGPIASASHNGQDGVSEAAPLSNDLPLSLGGSGSAAGQSSFRSATNATAITNNMVLPVRNLPPNILPGEVFDVPKTHLDVGAGTDGATVITADGRDVRLEAQTTLVLLPKREPSSHTQQLAMGGTGGGLRTRATLSVPTPASPAVALAPQAPAEPPDITDLCTGSCTTLAQTSAVPSTPSTVSGSVPLNALGFLPASGRERTRFSQDPAVVYLDAGHVLCTFDPHRLRERTEFDTEASRTVRAVMVNTSNYKVERVFDWRVRGSGQYLWQLSSGHLLVHLGRDLKELDATLNAVRIVHLDGPVAWVVPSPSGTHLVVGTIHERYSAVYRNALTAVSDEEPEEDVEVRLYDERPQPLFTVVRSSKLPPPVLSDTGELRVERVGAGRWRITEVNWQRQEHLLAVSHSACRPSLFAPEHGLIFMLGCTASGERWYRMLRADGHPVLKGASSSKELAQTAQASRANAFAVRTVEAERSRNIGQPFRLADLKSEHITVYNSTTGARLSSLTTQDFALSEQDFALSPNGDQMATVGRDAVHFYPIAHVAP